MAKSQCFADITIFKCPPFLKLVDTKIAVTKEGAKTKILICPERCSSMPKVEIKKSSPFRINKFQDILYLISYANIRIKYLARLPPDTTQSGWWENTYLLQDMFSYQLKISSSKPKLWCYFEFCWLYKYNHHEQNKTFLLS